MPPYYANNNVTLHHGNSLDVLKTLPDASVDAVVCDPPYGLADLPANVIEKALTTWLSGDRTHVPEGRGGFMGSHWDRFVPPPGVWDECMRVLKPGGHLAAFAGSRTVDLMGLSIRLAGFELRDSLVWHYGSGFPKSLDVSKAIDKQRTEDLQPAAEVARWLVDQLTQRGIGRRDVTEHFGAANIAQQWTTIRVDRPVKPRVPCWEQWEELKRWLDLPDDMDAEVWRLNGRKGTPGEAWAQRAVLSERVVEVKGGSWAEIVATGRFKPGKKIVRETVPATREAARWSGWGTALKPAHEPIMIARKPLAGTVAGNVLAHGTGALNIDGCRTNNPGPHGQRGRRAFNGFSDDQRVYGDGLNHQKSPENPAGRWPTNVVLSHPPLLDEHGTPVGDACAERCVNGCPVSELDRQGGASRFFPVFRYQAKAPTRERPRLSDGTAHPTVKPVHLMRWLVRLLTPPGGTVLDPFAGSGTTLEAAALEGFTAIGVEQHEPYAELCRVRLGKPAAAALFEAS